MTLFDLQPSEFEYRGRTDQGLCTDVYRLEPERASWVTPNRSPEFAIDCDGELHFSTEMDFECGGWETNEVRSGVTETTCCLRNTALGVEVTVYYRTFASTRVLEKWAVVTNVADQPIVVGRFDTFCMRLPADEYQLQYFLSGWGKEFTPVVGPLIGTKVLEGVSGRSSAQMNPLFVLESEERGVLISTVVWSGNWIYRFEPQVDGSYLATGGINPWQFNKRLAKGEQLEGIHVVTAIGAPGDIDHAAIEMARWGRAYHYPENALSRALPVEWNHWWPYTDEELTDEIFKANVDAAADMGVEICTLDAGWFGPVGKSYWYNYRGDWDRVNTMRFPKGVRDIADHVHDRGMKFGLWCEIEAVGKDAEFNDSHPDLVAKRDDNSVGTICLGNPEAEEWAFQTLDRLITDYCADWVKLDYNVNVGAGCNRTDHGHDAGDGLYEQYAGYYRLLARVREKHPEVVLENCSSGGLRFDLGVLGQTHVGFLSDPDTPVHSLQLFWAATLMVAPNACLHWPWSQTRGSFPSLDLPTEEITGKQLDYYFRIGMLHTYGLSHRLPDLPDWIRERLAEHIRYYKDKVKPFILEADLYHLTEQPLRDGTGDRWCGFEYAMPDQKDVMVFVFRLPGGEPQRWIKLKGLLPDATYEVHWEDSGLERGISAQALMTDGVLFEGLPEEGSEILRLRLSE
ncbi:MAG: alpha-galactosidase [Chloroflexi bacterium]|nr:alpha-galactosidase [Chloroflexota bacterium]